MSILPCTEGVVVQCDMITKVFLEKSDHSLFIKTDKEAYVRSLIDDWIDMNNTPKKEEENHGKGRK